MKPLLKAELSQLLSSYVDGELDDQQRKLVEEIVSKDPEARRELEELRALKNLVAEKRRLPASIGFWTRVSSEIERRKKEDENLLPFPRRYFPLVAGMAAVLVIAVGIVLYQQRASVVNYVSRQTERVQKAVGDNVLKGSIMPLFSRVDKNQALQFAMFGTLPLDAKAETEFRVNEDSARGYTIDVDKKGARRTPSVTVKEFVDEVQPTHGQREIIDSLLDLGRQKLEESIFVAEDKAMAIDPQLSRLNRVMLSGIAAALEPEQRTRFEKFLRVRSAPYMISGGRKASESSERILHTMRIVSRPEPFLVVTPDTVVMSSFHLNMDSLRRHFQRVEQGRERVVVNMNGLIRRIAEQREDFARQRVMIPVPHVQVVGDSDFISIQFGSGWDEMSVPMPELWVKPRFPGHFGTSGRQRDMSPFGGDSSFYFNFQFNNMEIDSLVQRMMKGGVPPGFESMMGDIRGNGGRPQMNAGKIKRALDSAFLAKKGGRSKLDSLMREMDKREQRRLQELKEKDNRN
jgi:hypothetical protein